MCRVPSPDGVLRGQRVGTAAHQTSAALLDCTVSDDVSHTAGCHLKAAYSDSVEHPRARVYPVGDLAACRGAYGRGAVRILEGDAGQVVVACSQAVPSRRQLHVAAVASGYVEAPDASVCVLRIEEECHSGHVGVCGFVPLEEDVDVLCRAGALDVLVFARCGSDDDRQCHDGSADYHAERLHLAGLFEAPRPGNHARHTPMPVRPT